MPAYVPALTDEVVIREYMLNKKSDRQIAEMFGCDRTTILLRRRKLHITARQRAGSVGEQSVYKELVGRGFYVVDMNEVESKIHPFDLRVNQSIRIDVKTASVCRDRYCFPLTQKFETGLSLDSGNYVQVASGRIKKLLHKSCDFVILCCLGNVNHFYIVPSTVIPKSLNNISIPEHHRSKWGFWSGRWDLIEPEPPTER